MRLIRTIKNLLSGFTGSTISRSNHWMEQLNSLGFDKIAFPILIKDGNDLNLVYLEEFAIDADLHYHEFDTNYELIDSNGKVWTWKYDTQNKTNLPGRYVRTMPLDDVKQLVNNYFRNSKMKREVEALTAEETSILQLFQNLADKF